ncbi:hypothetical protein VNO78_23275 [Psophocarpus tetragonolobus]|uniref:Uncharacterized protein n=1 Tax=Psophocarpus tetragonolobus TaxID=3891 RepID=A0AAN9S2Y7_PSOTE
MCTIRNIGFRHWQSIIFVCKNCYGSRIDMAVSNVLQENEIQNKDLLLDVDRNPWVFGGCIFFLWLKSTADSAVTAHGDLLMVHRCPF